MRDGRVSTAALRVHSDSAQGFFSKHHRQWELLSAPVVHTAVKTVFDAVDLAMIANSTALTQACKRGGLIECSAEVLEGQLVSAVRRSSVGYGCTVVCINCICWSITARSIVLALASTRMRKPCMQRQAVRNVQRSCSLMMPDRSSVR